MKTAPQIACGSVVFFCAAILLPGSAAAQQQPLSVSPTSVSVQATVGSNAPSQTVQVKKRGKPTTQVSWSVVPPTATWVSVSPTGGVNDGTLTLNFTTSALAVGQYQTSFSVQSITVNVQATIVGSAPPPLVANCPANKTASSPNGQPVPVTYDIPTPSGGTLPYTTISGSPQSGSNFPVGTTPVTVTVQDSSQPQQTDTCSFTVTVTDSSPPPPPPSSGRGPQSTNTCPGTTINITPADSVAIIQSLINANAGATTFCFRAGIYHLNGSITPKTGNTFVGEYISENNKAILDGTGWTTPDHSQAAFRIYDEPNDPTDPNGDVDNVTIRNLVIRNMPQYAIHGSHTRGADHWTIEYNEIASNKFGLLFSRDFTIRNNYIHHNVGNPSSSLPGERGGGYLGQFADNTIVDNNDIAWNGPEQKVVSSVNVTFRNNFVHHNVRDGIWFDLNNRAGDAIPAAIVQGNRVEDNGANGITVEISIGAIISGNTIRRNNGDGVLITVSQRAEIYNNLLEGNLGGIEYFLNCGSFSEGHDLRDNAAYDNTIFVTHSFTVAPWASAFSRLSLCTSAELAPFLDGSKNLTFTHNTYHVPSLSFTRYFIWDGAWKDWNQWRALGSTMTPPRSLQDVDGSLISP